MNSGTICSGTTSTGTSSSPLVHFPGDSLLFERVIVATSPAIFAFISTRDASSLRLTSRLFLEMVTDWDDATTSIGVSVIRWRKCFPRAVGASLLCFTFRADKEFAALVGLHRVSFRGNSPGIIFFGPCDRILDQHFVNIQGVQSLNMRSCISITDNAFKNMLGVHTLNMSSCYQSALTDEAFENLHGIHILDMSSCKQTTISDKAFENLRGIHTLDMSSCNQPSITNKAFENLCGIHTLCMSSCNQTTITDEAFENLRGIHTLNMSECNQPEITVKALDYLEASRVKCLIPSSTQRRYGSFTLDYIGSRSRCCS